MPSNKAALTHQDDQTAKLKNRQAAAEPSPSQEGADIAEAPSFQSGEQALTALQRTPNRGERQQVFQSIQRQFGNQYAAKVARQVRRSATASVVQRHSPDAVLVPNANQAAAEVQNAGTSAATEPLPTPEAGGTPQEGPMSDDTDVGTGATGTGTAGKTAGTGATTGGTTTGTGTTPASTTPPPTTVLTGTMDVSYAQKAITDSFGTVAPKAIITGAITVVDNMDALYAAYDKVCIDDNILNKSTGKKWAAGDLKKINTAKGLRTNAFAYKGKVWVDKSGTDPTATVHEMLHVNTASDFLGKVGRIVNEGTTQKFAVKAIKAKGGSVSGSENTYQAEQGVVTNLIAIITESTLTDAYFKGGDTLINAYEAKKGKGSWATLKALLDAETYTSINTTLTAPAPTPTPTPTTGTPSTGTPPTTS